MECPVCRSESNKVIDSKSQKDKIRRRRQCSECGARFFTEETIVSDGTNSIDASFESMHAMADMAKDLAIVEAIQAIGFMNELADKARFGILPFSSVPTIDPDSEKTDETRLYFDAILYDDNPSSPRYLSIIADKCIIDHHDIISYWDDIYEFLAFKAVEPSSGDEPYIEAAIPFSSLYACIDGSGWHLYEDSRRRDPLPYEQQNNLF